uniref:Putative secreted protein n=1 Tax=Anopheles triannulatus TaxID=58253 RepID=A0A2M4B118_9DIPT
MLLKLPLAFVFALNACCAGQDSKGTECDVMVIIIKCFIAWKGHETQEHRTNRVIMYIGLKKNCPNKLSRQSYDALLLEWSCIRLEEQ